MVGQTVGKYRIVSRLGRGGMGTVYKAVDTTLDRDVAIKCLNADLGDADLLKRFRAEAMTLARLNHPNIAILFELTEHEGQLLMVMEFVRGETFDRLSQREGPMPIGRAAQLCVQVLDALGHAHRAGVVHRDLKPANLMLTESGLVKVMDFGLARMAGTEHLTNDGYMVGTPAYMSPEQVLGRDIDGRADLYAMGVVLFRLLTGQLPFKADSGIAMVQRQLNDPPTPVRQLRQELSDACEAVIARALAKPAGERFQTAEELKSALAELDPTTAGTGLSRIAMTVPSTPAAAPLESEPTLPPTPTPLSSAAAGLPPATVVMAREALPDGAATPSGTAAAPSQQRKTEPLAAGEAQQLAALPGPPPSAPARVAGITSSAAPASPRRPVRSPILPLALAAGVLLIAGVPAAMLWRAHRAAVVPASETTRGVAAVTSAPVPETAAAPAPPPASAAPPTPVNAAPSGATAPSVAAAPDSRSAPSTSAKAAVDRRDSRLASIDARTLARAARPALPVVTFGKLKLLVVEENKTRDRDAELRLGADALDVLDGRTPLRSTPYSDVIGVYHSHSKEPRWTMPDGSSAPVIKTGGVFGFLRGTPDWITVRTKTLFIPLRVREEDVRRLATELEARTGSRVVVAK